jgi:hypothetical protein
VGPLFGNNIVSFILLPGGCEEASFRTLLKPKQYDGKYLKFASV